MSDILLLINNIDAITFILVFVCGLLLYLYILYKTKNAKIIQENINLKYNLANSKNDNVALKQELLGLQNEQKEYIRLNSELKVKLQEQNLSLNQQIKLLEQSEKRLKVEFENLANRIFETNSKNLKTQNIESMSHILSPIKEQMNSFRKKIEDVYDKESKDRSALANELKNLKELNIKISTDANNLTNALKGDNKIQGNWGEMVLDRVLESSGLTKDREYKKQVVLKDNKGGRYMPDVIVYLPDNRQIIIDAKTSLSAYNEYISCKDADLKQELLKKHIKSIKNHIDELSNKEYNKLEGINSLDFVFMFVSIEGALLLALDNDSSLYDYAFKNKIILVSPTTLLVSLRAVENTWRYENQAQDIKKVYKRADELYKKFVGFVDDLSKVGVGLDNAQKTYDAAFKKLKSGNGNLVWQSEQLKKDSHIKPKKDLPSNLIG